MTPQDVAELQGIADDMRRFLFKVGTGVVVAVVIAASTNLATMLYWKGGLDQWRATTTEAVAQNSAMIHDIEQWARESEK